jgi:hypothetical protein
MPDLEQQAEDTMNTLRVRNLLSQPDKWMWDAARNVYTHPVLNEVAAQWVDRVLNGR